MAKLFEKRIGVRFFLAREKELHVAGMISTQILRAKITEIFKVARATSNLSTRSTRRQLHPLPLLNTTHKANS